MADRKAVVKNADMTEDMQQDAIDISTQALEKFNIEKDIAAFIKKEFDKKYNPTWHCIVGRNFGSYVTHETKHFIYFYLGQVAILLFKSGWSHRNKQNYENTWSFFLWVKSINAFLKDVANPPTSKHSAKVFWSFGGLNLN